LESPIKGRIIARGEAVHPFSIKGAEVNLFALIFVMSQADSLVGLRKLH